MCIRTQNANRAVVVPSQNGYIGLENMKISKKDKQGNLRKDKQGKMTPNAGSIAEPGSFGLEKRWLKKDETEVFKTCSSVSCSGFFSTRKRQTY